MKEQVELARSDVRMVSAVRSSAVESVNKLTMKVTTLEESLSQLQGENVELKGHQESKA